MAALYDDAGNQIEGALSPDEAKVLQEKAALADTLQNQVKEKDELLTKLQDKDFNFESLRKASAEEREKLLANHSEKERKLIEQIEKQNSLIEGISASQIAENKTSVLEALAGTDEDLKKQIELAASEFAGEAKTKEEWAARLSKAYTIVKGMKPTINPLNRFTAAGPQSDMAGGTKFINTQTGKDTYKSLFPNDPQPS